MVRIRNSGPQGGKGAKAVNERKLKRFAWGVTALVLWVVYVAMFIHFGWGKP